MYRPVLPEEYEKMMRTFGITSAIIVEASAWVEDNQWVLDLIADHPKFSGLVGRIEAGMPGFQNYLHRFARNPRFRGIRLGEQAIRERLGQPQFVTDLKTLASAGLELDTVGGPSMMAELVRLTDRVPNLRIVIDHLPYDPPEDKTARETYESALHELGKRPRVYVKVSHVLRRKDGALVTDLSFYRPALDELLDIFGEDRLIYGSNWPVSERIAPYRPVLDVVRAYFTEKGQRATDKYFYKNAIAAYHPYKIRA
jgi:L-fuconolactonase